MSDRIYLDHNASTPLMPDVRAAMLEALAHHGNASSVHKEGRVARRMIEEAREKIAALVNAIPSEVVFTSGGTEANVTALSGLAVQMLSLDTSRFGSVSRMRPDLRWVAFVSSIEHASVLAGGRFDADELFKLPVDPTGVVDVDRARAQVDRVFDGITDLEDLDDGDGPLFMTSVMLANNETGAVQPIQELARLTHDMKGVMHTDAVQAAGKIPVDFKALEADLLSLSAHKIGGPAGTGAVITKDDALLLDAPLILGGGQEGRRRAGTENLAGIVGFGVAAELAQKNLANEAKRLGALRDDLEDGLRHIAPEIVVFAADAMRLPNTSCFAIKGMNAETLLIQLDLAGLAVSAGSACSSGKVSASHVLAAMDVPGPLAECAIRVSLGWTTKKQDISAFLGKWEKLFKQFHARRSAA